VCSAHFETVLEHAHEQLQMALALNDSVDKRWMEDVQRRNKQTLEGMKQFQTKCQRLYEERLKDYVASTEDQLRRYVTSVFIVHVGGTRGATRSIDRIVQRRACATWGVALIRAILFHLF
tara:strand:- start:188 stop:547 length:360 start_codon:yes stop_codon:yes gene_type:complete